MLYSVRVNLGDPYLFENKSDADKLRIYAVKKGCNVIVEELPEEDDLPEDFPVKDKSRADRRRNRVLHNRRTKKNYAQVYCDTENLCRSRKKLAISHSYNVSAHGREMHRISKPEVDRVEMFHYLCDLNERSEVYAD